MEAPSPRQSREQIVKDFETHIEQNYVPEEKDGKKYYSCRKCGTKIEQVNCAISIHSKLFTACTGEGKVENVPLPYCPECEGIPKKTSTCIHE